MGAEDVPEKKNGYHMQYQHAQGIAFLSKETQKLFGRV